MMPWRPFGRPVGPSRIQIDQGQALAPKGHMLLGYDERNHAVHLTAAELASGVRVVGQAGTGKASLNKLLAYQQIQRGGGLVFADGSPCAQELQTILEICRACGREQDLQVLMPASPELSNTYNPVLRGPAEQIVDRLMLLLPPSTGAAFAARIRGGLLVLVAALLELNIAVTLADLSVLLMSTRAVSQLERRLQLERKDNPVTAGLTAFIEQQCSTGDARMTVTFGGMVGWLLELWNGHPGASTINTYRPDIDLLDVVQENKIVYFAQPPQGRGRADKIWRMFSADLQSAIAFCKKDVAKQHLPPEFLVIEDHLQEAGESGEGTVRTSNLVPAAWVKASEEADACKDIRITFKCAARDDAARAASLVGLAPTMTDSLIGLAANQVFMQRAGASTQMIRIPFVVVSNVTRVPFDPARSRVLRGPHVVGANYAECAGYFLDDPHALSRPLTQFA